MLCNLRMSRSTTLPPIRIAPETKASLEAVLREGESLTQFIEGAVCREAEYRVEQNAAVERARIVDASQYPAVGLQRQPRHHILQVRIRVMPR